jgi:L-lactate dehydrogenase (cytochrome)
MARFAQAADIADLRERARCRLPNMLFEYIDGGSYAQDTLRRNVSDFAQIALRQRVMRDMSTLDMQVNTLGQTLSLPVALGPVGLAGMYARRGEVQAARAAAAEGVPFCLSTVGICSVEEVAKCGTAPWFQLYVLKDRGYMRELLRRVRAVGCPVLILTVDLPIPGARYRDVRSGFSGVRGARNIVSRALDGLAHPRWLWDVWVRGRPHALGSIADALETNAAPGDFLNWIAKNFDRSVTWSDLDWIRKEWDAPIIIKGVLDTQDARDAFCYGAQGIIVSNHGGRQLDGVQSSIRALPGIVDALAGRLEIYIDGGVRSGLDVLKAVALGAKCCFVGRAWAYALGSCGEKGVRLMLRNLRAELEVAMVLTGCHSMNAAGRQLLEGEAAQRDDRGA